MDRQNPYIAHAPSSSTYAAYQEVDSTVKTSREYQEFNRAMDAILRADPAKVKDAVDAEIQTNTAERDARGERKRGRKPKSTKQDS